MSISEYSSDLGFHHGAPDGTTAERRSTSQASESGFHHGTPDGTTAQSSGRIFAWLSSLGESLSNRASDTKTAIADFGSNHKVGLKRAGMVAVGLAVAVAAAAAIYALAHYFGIDASKLQNFSDKTFTTLSGWGSTAGSFITANWQPLLGGTGLVAAGFGLGVGATELAHRSRAKRALEGASDVDPARVPLPDSGSDFSAGEGRDGSGGTPTFRSSVAGSRPGSETPRSDGQDDRDSLVREAARTSADSFSPAQRAQPEILALSGAMDESERTDLLASSAPTAADGFREIRDGAKSA